MRGVCALTILTSLTLAACAQATKAPPAAPLKEVIEYRQVINSDAERDAELLREFFNLTAVVEPRVNAIIMRGQASDVAAAVDLLNKLETLSLSGLNPTVVFIMHLQNARAQDVVPLLQEMSRKGYFKLDRIPAPIFALDERTNAVIVHGDKENEERIRDMVHVLDQPSGSK